MQPQVFEPNFLNLEYLFGAIYTFFGTLFSGGAIDFSQIINVIAAIFSVIAILLIAVIVYTWVRIYEINKKEHAEHKALFMQEHVSEDPVPMPIINPRWEQVQKHIKSDTPADWRLAILEADLMLEDLLVTLGYKEGTIGDKLKAIEPSDFPGHDRAWWAHRVRNNIAHQGSTYILGKAEARNTIAIFEEVFRANNYI